MPRYMLDTNMCIYLIKNQPAKDINNFKTVAETRTGIDGFIYQGMLSMGSMWWKSFSK